LHFRIRKDQGQRFFTSVTDALFDRAYEDRIPSDQILAGLKAMIPLVPTEAMIPLVEAFVGYASNKNFWLNTDIWKGDAVYPEDEYTLETHKAFVDAGKASASIFGEGSPLNISPDRFAVALTKLFTSGNIWTSLAGGAYNMLTTGLLPFEKEEIDAEMIASIPGARRIMKLGPRIPHPLAQESFDIRKRGNTMEVRQNREIEFIITNNKDNPYPGKQINTYIRTQPGLDQKRLNNRAIAEFRLRNIPDRSFYLMIMGADPEERAEAFMLKYKDADTIERQIMQNTARKIPGFASERFLIHFGRLRRESTNMITGKEQIVPPSKSEIPEEQLQQRYFE